MTRELSTDPQAVYMRRYMAEYRSLAGKRRRGLRVLTIRLSHPRRFMRPGHCSFCSLRCIGWVCCFCAAEIEGRPTPRVA